ncbi:hypothetical protein NKH89_29520, partial [Mesorhizobium sp. M0923]
QASALLIHVADQLELCAWKLLGDYLGMICAHQAGADHRNADCHLSPILCVSNLRGSGAP